MKKIFLILACILLFTGTAHSLEVSQGEMFWLTQNIYWESRNQPTMGQYLVGLVTLNRMQSTKWPDTIKAVVTQPSQVSWYWDGKSDIPKEPEAWKRAQKIAKYVCNLYDHIDPMHKRVYWFHRDDVNPSWRSEYVKYAKVDRHIFYSDT